MWEQRSVETMYRLRDSESCRRWFLATAFIRSQGPHYLFQFAVKQRVIFLPAAKVSGHAARDFRLLAALVIGAEQVAVQVELNQHEGFLALLVNDLRLLLERTVDLAVHPPNW